MLVKLYFFPHPDMAEVNVYNWDIVDTDWQPLTGLGDWFEKEQELVDTLVLNCFTNTLIPHKEGSANKEERELLIDYIRGGPTDIDDLGDDAVFHDQAEELRTEYEKLEDCAFLALCFPYGKKRKTFEEEKRLFSLAADDAFRFFTEKWKAVNRDEGKVRTQKEICLTLAEAKTSIERFFGGIGQRAKAVKVITIGHGAPGGLFRMRDEGTPVPSNEIPNTVGKSIENTVFPLQMDVVFCQCHACDNLPETSDPDRVQVNALATSENRKIRFGGKYKVYGGTRIPVQDADGNRQFVTGKIPRLREYLSDSRNMPRLREYTLEIEAGAEPMEMETD